MTCRVSFHFILTLSYHNTAYWSHLYYDASWTEVNHLCFWVSSSVSLLQGSATKILETRSFNDFDTPLGKAIYFASLILSNNSYHRQIIRE